MLSFVGKSSPVLVLLPKLNCSPNRLKYAVHETPASPLLLLEFSVSPPRPSHEEEERAQNRRGRKRGGNSEEGWEGGVKTFKHRFSPFLSYSKLFLSCFSLSE